jgi:hypothetical protein
MRTRPRKKTRAKRSTSRSDLSQVDLPQLARELRGRIRSRAPIDYQQGRLKMRNELMTVLECSQLRADHIVSSMVARGYARFAPHPHFMDDRTVGQWQFDPAPGA